MARPSVTEPPGRVDVEGDVLVGVLGLQEDELGADEVGRDLVDRAADEDDALLEEPLEDASGGVQVGPGGRDEGGCGCVGHGHEASGRSGHP